MKSMKFLIFAILILVSPVFAGSGAFDSSRYADITSGSITGVTIDNSVIGGTTPAAGTFNPLASIGDSGASSCFSITADAGEDDADKWQYCVADNGNATLESKATGSWRAVWTVSSSGAFSVLASLLPNTSGGSELGSSLLEWGSFYQADDAAHCLGSDQDFCWAYDSSSGYLQLSDGSSDFLTITDDGSTATFDFKLGTLTGLADAVNPTDAANLQTVLEHTGVSFNYYLGNTTLDLTLTESEDSILETQNLDPDQLSLIFFVALEADTITPFMVPAGTVIPVHFDANLTTTAGRFDTLLYVKLGYVDSDGSSNFVQIGANSDNTGFLTAAQTSYEQHIHVTTEITVPVTKRLYLQVWADSSGSGGFGEINFYFDSVGHHLQFAVGANILEDFLVKSKDLSDVASASTSATNLGLGTGDTPQFTGIEVGNATDTTITRPSGGDIAVEGNIVYRAGGTDVPVTDGGTGAGTASAGFDALSPMTTVGDIIYGGASGTGTRLGAGATTEILVGGGAAAPVWTTATGTAAPVRADSPTFTTAIDISDGNITSVGDIELDTISNEDGTLSMTIAASTGNVTFNGTANLGSTGQLVFPASQNASANANTLDDYEEGTWTPEIADASTGGNVGSAAASLGIYTKIGRVVTLEFSIVTIDTTGMTAGNNFFIRNAPFAHHTSVNGYGSLLVDNVTFTGSIALTIASNVTYMNLLENSSGGASDFILVSEVADDSATIRGTITYQTN